VLQSETNLIFKGRRAVEWMEVVAALWEKYRNFMGWCLPYAVEF
jgi:hypothetical protein